MDILIPESTVALEPLTTEIANVGLLLASTAVDIIQAAAETISPEISTEIADVGFVLASTASEIIQAAVETITPVGVEVVLKHGPAIESLAPIFSTYSFISPVLALVFNQIPWFTYQFLYMLLNLTITATITLDLYSIMWLSLLAVIFLFIILRYRTAKLPISSEPRKPFHMTQEPLIEDEKDEKNGYPDEFMNAFLSSIKVFGYLDKPVFHELARHLQTKKLKAGEILFDNNTKDQDFYVVVEGCVQLFVKGSSQDRPAYTTVSPDFYEDDRLEGHHLLHQVEDGGTVSSLFTILSVFTQSFKLPSPLSELQADVVIPSPEHSPSTSVKSEPDSPAATFQKTGSSLRGVATAPPIAPSSSLSVDTSTPIEILPAEAPSSVSESMPSTEMEQPVFAGLSEGLPKAVPRDAPNFELLRSVHPNLVARAKKSTSLAVIPAAAFRKLTEKFPNAAAHIAQVILTRFQRVTFMTLYRYLGLSKELLDIERRVNGVGGYGLPPALFSQDVIHDLNLKHEFFRFRETNAANQQPRPPVPEDSFSSIKSLPLLHSPFANGFNDDEIEALRDSVFKCIAHLLGMTATRGKLEAKPAVRSRRGTLPPLGGTAMDRYYYSHAQPADTPLPAQTRQRMRNRYIDADDLSTPSISSRASSVDFSDDENEVPDIQIIHCHQGQVIIQEGQRNGGLYFVIDGILEVSAAPKDRFGLDLGQNSGSALFRIQPGGLAGYLAALTGNMSFVTITAHTDSIVGFMPKSVLDRYVELYPNILLCLSKRLLEQLSPLIFHIDVALEWGQVNAGQVLCRQGDPAHSIFIVLTGRLRSIEKSEKSKLDLAGEYGESESVGEMQVLMEMPRPSTVHAIRDTEVAIFPKTLFNALSIQHPEIMLTIARIIAQRSTEDLKKRNASIGVSGTSNVNLKTVCLLPLSANVPISKFSQQLCDALGLLGSSVARLNSSTITNQLGKHAFSRLGRLKLISWLAEQEEAHGKVIYVADGDVSSTWNQRCIRQADCILLIGLADGDNSVSDVERLLSNIKTTARKELVLIHPKREVVPLSTTKWLSKRPWIQAHHHVQMILPSSNTFGNSQKKQLTLLDLKDHFQSYMSSDAAPLIVSGHRSDFSRLARRLLSKSIGLVLGGGGARGLAHVGIIRAFEEVGIPFDMVGGTSIGAFVGALYSRNQSHVSIWGRAKMVSLRMISPWRSLIDLTYPVTSLFTGHEFNRAIWKCFSDTVIEDSWLPYFCVTTNITWSRLDVHTSGYMWRYVRASMSLSGFVPPLCDNGDMLMDGGYVNNLPADIMQSMGASIVFHV